MPTKSAVRTPLLRWIGGVAAAVALSMGGVIVAAAPASAAASDCPNGQTCVWKDSDFASGGWGFYYRGYVNGISKFSSYTFGGTQGNVDNNVTSIYNNGNSQTSSLYNNQYFSSFLVSYSIKSGSANLGWANDQASSGGFTFCVNNPYSHICQ